MQRCGGYKNHSAVRLKISYISTGNAIFVDNSQWVTADLQTPRCRFYPDRNGMLRCNNGTLQCYNKYETQRLQRRCQQQVITYINENTNASLITTDYPVACRVYTPCVCQDLLFVDNSTLQSVVYPIGDM